MRADGSHEQRLTRTAKLSEDLPAWSPDGTQIAYNVLGGGVGGGANHGIWVMNADGSHRYRLTRIGYGAAWSPDGKTIAFYTEDFVYLVPAAGGRPKRLGDGYRAAPDWSPDGRRVAFCRGDDLWVMSSDGSHQRQLTSTAAWNEEDPAWSPDGHWIAYSRLGAEPRGSGPPTAQLYLIHPSGTGRHAITRDEPGTLDEFPTWQPR